MSQEDMGLRARLVETGVELVGREGMQALSLREIARRAGVSHGAPRRYFPTHLSLLSAIAGRGFAELGVKVGEVAGDGGATGPRERVVALGRVYVDFALANPGMFELMFRHDLLQSDELGLRETSLPLFGVLVDLVERAGAGAGAGPGASVVAGALWANVHGIAQLWAWGSLQLATGLADVDTVLRAAVDAHLGPVGGGR